MSPPTATLFSTGLEDGSRISDWHFKHVFTYKQWKRLARDLEFSLNATPTELSFEQWLDLYYGFKRTRADPPRYLSVKSPWQLR